jgi:hypothetical protein
MVMTSGDGQCCWPVAGHYCWSVLWPAVLASITVLLASGAGQYCWRVMLASIAGITVQHGLLLPADMIASSQEKENQLSQILFFKK